MQRENPAGHHATAQNSSFECNCSYFKSPSAIFKIAQAISSLLAFVCVQGYWMYGCGGCLEWFRAATMSGLVLSFMFLFAYLINIVGKFDQIPWRTIDVCCCILWLIFNISAATRLAVVLSQCDSCSSSFRSGSIGSIFFGFVTAIAYGGDAGLQLCNCIRGIRT